MLKNNLLMKKYFIQALEDQINNLKQHQLEKLYKPKQENQLVYDSKSNYKYL